MPSTKSSICFVVIFGLCLLSLCVCLYKNEKYVRKLTAPLRHDNSSSSSSEEVADVSETLPVPAEQDDSRGVSVNNFSKTVLMLPVVSIKLKNLNIIQPAEDTKRNDEDNSRLVRVVHHLMQELRKCKRSQVNRGHCHHCDHCAQQRLVGYHPLHRGMDKDRMAYKRRLYYT